MEIYTPDSPISAPKASAKIIKCDGQKGKTSSAFILMHILKASDISSAYIGNNGTAFFDGNFSFHKSTGPFIKDRDVYYLERSGADFLLIESGRADEPPSGFYDHIMNTDLTEKVYGKAERLHGTPGINHNGDFIPLIGKYALINALTAVDMAVRLGIDRQSAMSALSDVSIPGRLENIITYNGISVVVDFAHTGEGYVYALESIRPYVSGKLICVAGCSGIHPERSEGIGKALHLADSVVITSEDNHYVRFGDHTGAVHKYLEHLPHNIIEDRFAAIQFALRSASEGDIVLICGKGMEKFIYYSTSPAFFDERIIIKNTVAAMKYYNTSHCEQPSR